MKTFVHSWQDLAEFLLEWEMFQTEVVEKIKTHILYSITPHPPPPHEYLAVYERVWEKHGRTRQAADDNVIRRLRFACWMTKATHTHLEYVIPY